MTQIELVPDLDHCIETAARLEYRRSVDEYLRQGGGGQELEAKIELLRQFLETANFRELRRESERYLEEGKKVKFIIRWHEGKLTYELKTL